MPTDTKNAIDLTDGGIIKSVITEMINMVLELDSTGNMRD